MRNRKSLIHHTHASAAHAVKAAGFHAHAHVSLGHQAMAVLSGWVHNWHAALLGALDTPVSTGVAVGLALALVVLARCLLNGVVGPLWSWRENQRRVSGSPGMDVLSVGIVFLLGTFVFLCVTGFTGIGGGLFSGAFNVAGSLM